MPGAHNFYCSGLAGLPTLPPGYPVVAALTCTHDVLLFCVIRIFIYESIFFVGFETFFAFATFCFRCDFVFRCEFSY